MEAWDIAARTDDILQANPSTQEVMARARSRLQPKHRPQGDRECSCHPLQWEHEAVAGACHDEVPALLDQVYQI